MKQVVADWIRTRDFATVPAYCRSLPAWEDPSPAFDAWYPRAMRSLAELPCDELDTRLVVYGDGPTFGVTINRRSLPRIDRTFEVCDPSDGVGLAFEIDASGTITCVAPVVDEGYREACYD